MLPMERINALLEGMPIDRVPVWLWLISPTLAASNVGYPLASIFQYPEKCFLAQVWTQEMYDSDDIPRQCFGGDATLPFGGEIKLPSGEFEQAPSIVRYPVTSEEDAWKLKVPNDLITAQPVPLYMQLARLQEKDGFPVSAWCNSPLDFVRGLCGTDTLCRWLIKKPDVVHHLLKLANDYSLKLMRHWVDTFVPERILVQTVAPTTSNQVISPKHFAEFSLPYQKELHEKILAMGIRHIFCHICGDQNMNLSYWAQVPMGDPGIVSFGQEVDLATAIELFGDICIIAGNIEPAVIQAGTPQEIYELCGQAIEKAKHAPRGYILMPGCGISPRVPPYNAYMMKKAVEDFGRYDW
ncbi:MAG: uroporphyrinogen decarboxylase family protein [Chloroflexota bacterium]